LHWFDTPAFFQEVKRVLKPQGVIAVWCYNLSRLGEPFDAVIRHFYSDTLGPYWPPERRLIDECYRTIPFPFTESAPPAFHMAAEWTLDEYLGYLGTWSATQRYRQQQGTDPLPALRVELSHAWSAPQAKRTVKWPIHLRIGKV